MSRTYRDPIHGDITLNSEISEEDLIIRLIDCPEFQRLRQVKQLGVGWMVYHGAEHSRFGHSIGCMHVARKMFDHYNNLYKGQEWWDEGPALSRPAVLVAALLHDIGHMPFSHSAEKIVDIHHEDITLAILQDPLSYLRENLLQYDSMLVTEVLDLLEHKHPYEFLSDIISGQLDADRMDYLLRDSHYTGVTYGHFDLDVIIDSLRIDVDTHRTVISTEKGVAAVERYLHAGYQIYKQVMYHKTILGADILLQNIFQRAKDLIVECESDPSLLGNTFLHLHEALLTWLTKDISEFDLTHFMHLNDSFLHYHLQQWQFSPDTILSDLCGRFINRVLFKANKVESDEDEFEVFFCAEDDDMNVTFEPQSELEGSYYYRSVEIPTKPSRFYNPDIEGEGMILVYDKSGAITEISQVSDVIKSLKQDGQVEEYIISI